MSVLVSRLCEHRLRKRQARPGLGLLWCQFHDPLCGGECLGMCVAGILIHVRLVVSNRLMKRDFELIRSRSLRGNFARFRQQIETHRHGFGGINSIPSLRKSQRRRQTLKQISESADDKTSFYRLNLAHLYLGENLNSEALAILNLIRQTDPDFYISYQLAAQHGAANFMMERYHAAASDFSDPSLEGEEEIEFWKNTTALMQGLTTKSIKFPVFEKQYVRNYPPEMRRRLAIIAADQMLTKKRYNTALRFLKDNLDEALMNDFLTSLDHEAERMVKSAGTADHKEAVKAFVEKRKPAFAKT